MRTPLLPLTLLLASAAPLAAQHGHAHPAPAAPPSDSAFRRVQERGQGVMGVDQYTSRHVFASLEDGGSITLTRTDAADSAGIAQIRIHLREIAADFRRGVFSAPFLVHAQAVPGTAVMAARREHISYLVRDQAAGAELRIVTPDPEAKAAIHQFLAFQRTDHRAH